MLIICSFVTRPFFFLGGMFPPSLTHSTIDIVGDTLKSEPLGFLLVFLRCFSFVICPFSFYPLLALFGSFPLSFFFFSLLLLFFFFCCCCSVSWSHDLCFLLQRVFFSSWLHTRDGYMKTNARWTSGEDTLLPLNCAFFFFGVHWKLQRQKVSFMAVWSCCLRPLR